MLFYDPIKLKNAINTGKNSKSLLDYFMALLHSNNFLNFY